MRASDGDKDVLLLLMESTSLGGKGGFILPSSCVVELSPSFKRLGLYGWSLNVSSAIILSHRSLKSINIELVVERKGDSTSIICINFPNTMKLPYLDAFGETIESLDDEGLGYFLSSFESPEKFLW